MEKVIHSLTVPVPRPRLLRVAAYARVSSGKDAMLHSLSRQISYYSQMIQKHPGWTYAGCYADADYTGTRGERPEFQRLLADCRAGKIDRNLTKSVSRFARNTVTLLETARELKERGIAVFFEKERLDTLSGDGELLLSFLASFAQEESRSVSENCKWRVRKDFSEGRPMNLMLLYGYRSEKGRIVVDPEEAAVVRRIFHDYTHGLGSSLIAEALRKERIPCRLGGRWSSSLIRTMLTNEKYMGDALLQKTFCADHLTKKKVVNRGAAATVLCPGFPPGHHGPGDLGSGPANAAGQPGKNQRAEACHRPVSLFRPDRLRLLRTALPAQDQRIPHHLAVLDLSAKGQGLLPGQADPRGDFVSNHRGSAWGKRDHGRSSDGSEGDPGTEGQSSGLCFSGRAGSEKGLEGPLPVRKLDGGDAGAGPAP